MLTIEDLRSLNAAYFPHAPESLPETLKALDNPSSDDITAAALANLPNVDRNVRVLMLRVIAHHPNTATMQGILTGLSDDQRRVREVAIQSSANFLQYSEITQRLAEIATDDGEKRKIRSRALSMLAAFGGQALQGPLPQVAAAALEKLAANERYRSQILFTLLHLDLSEMVEKLLKEFVKNGSKEEAVMATKGLCGYKIVNLGSFDEAARKRIVQTCDLASGRVSYWVKREAYQKDLAA